MAHGELIMIGAYATYVVQNVFRQRTSRRVRRLSGLRDPGGVRCVSAAVGMVLERDGDPLSLRPAAGNAASRPGACR